MEVLIDTRAPTQKKGAVSRETQQVPNNDILQRALELEQVIHTFRKAVGTTASKTLFHCVEAKKFLLQCVYREEALVTELRMGD